MAKLLLGTGNRKKGEEMAALLAPLGIVLETLKDVPEAIEVEETGTTFRENATLKAVEQAKHLGRWVLAEDSGLAVDALDGGPGVYSARFSGEDATDEKNNELLREKLDEVPTERRGAGYHCHMVLADPEGQVRAESHGTCRGRITRDYRGDGGFGYDPLFEIPEYHQTFGELPALVKNYLSHRSRAASCMVAQLASLVSEMS